MNKLKQLLIVVMSSACVVTNAQEVGLSVGYGGYDMSGLKFKISSDMAGNLVQDAKVISSFPSSFIFGTHFSVPIGKRFEMGASGSLSLTASRASVVLDGTPYLWNYSLKGVHAALVPMIVLARKDKFTFFLETKGGLTLSYLSINRLEASCPSQNCATRFSSLNYFVEPAFRLKHQIGSGPFSVALRGGYHHTFARGNLYYRKERNAVLQSTTGSVRADWSGFRADVLLLYRFNR